MVYRSQGSHQSFMWHCTFIPRSFHVHGKCGCQFEGSMTFETNAVLVNCRQVSVQFFPGAEVALLTRIAVQAMLAVVVFPHFSFHFAGEPYHFSAVVAFGVEAEMRHHFRIYVADLWPFRPQLATAGIPHAGYFSVSDHTESRATKTHGLTQIRNSFVVSMLTNSRHAPVKPPADSEEKHTYSKRDRCIQTSRDILTRTLQLRFRLRIQYVNLLETQFVVDKKPPFAADNE